MPAIDYRGWFEHAPDAVLVVDAQGRYIDANEAACALTGYTRAELLKMRIGDLTIPSQRTYSERRFKLLRNTGHTRSDRVVRRKDGTQLPVEAHAVELGDGNYISFVRDISERVEAQQSLERSLDAYGTLVDLCHGAVISAGSDGRITSWNPGAVELFGYPPEEAVGMAITRLIPPKLRRKHLAGFRRHVTSEWDGPFARTLYTDGLRKDGTPVPIEVSAAVDRQGGEPVFTAVIRDFTEHREVVERLNDALQRLRFHIERMPLAYIVWDTEFKVLEWNPAAERIFGYTEAQATGRHAYELIVPHDVHATVDLIWADLLKGDTSSHSINENVCKDGSRRTCEWFNTPLRDAAGRIRGAASMAMDVSEREALESRIRDAQKLESLGVMAGGIAHDFNSFLMVILGNVALLRSIEDLPSQALEHIELMEDAGVRAKELIKHLLTYARTGKHNPVPTDLNGVIREALTFLRSSVGKEPELVVRLADRLPAILGDRSQIEQILVNLCLNAKRAMQKAGTIRIKTGKATLSPADAARCVPYDARPGPYIELTVADTGCGMDRETTMRIFDPFFTTKRHGHGLGLTAVLGILRQHRAFTRIDSTPGKGTRFHVYFPIHRDNSATGEHGRTARHDVEAVSRSKKSKGPRAKRTSKPARKQPRRTRTSDR